MTFSLTESNLSFRNLLIQWPIDLAKPSDEIFINSFLSTLSVVCILELSLEFLNPFSLSRCYYLCFSNLGDHACLKRRIMEREPLLWSLPSLDEGTEPYAQRQESMQPYH
ncbi:hypothetical protein AMTR_s00016p00227640 [Amborella trichopoda]|uniref:Uncharacterized protein n=1 Tax=Amborella trichopoda TaxID=13333 RepID=W1PGT0_AMBTC|nr:hypothetical protein AMTR_s00016p00227640 [Amborella trichopoda]